MYAIGLCFDENYLLPGLVTIMSIAYSTSECNRKSIAIRILTEDLTRPHADAVAAFSTALGFGSFDLEWRNLNNGHLVTNGGYITASTYLRFDFHPGFVKRPHLLYLDCDFLVLEDISSPFDRIGASQVGMVRDEFNSTVGECPALPGYVDRYPSFYGSPYFNAGAIWLDTNLMPTMKTGIIDVLRGHKRHYICFNDQDALNIWLLESGNVVKLPSDMNRFELGRVLELSDWARGVVCGAEGPRPASGLHFIGPIKPWLKYCPMTPGVRQYRFLMSEAQRLLRRLGIQTICVEDEAWTAQSWPEPQRRVTGADQ